MGFVGSMLVDSKVWVIDVKTKWARETGGDYVMRAGGWVLRCSPLLDMWAWHVHRGSVRHAGMTHNLDTSQQQAKEVWRELVNGSRIQADEAWQDTL